MRKATEKSDEPQAKRTKRTENNDTVQNKEVFRMLVGTLLIVSTSRKDEID